MKRIILVSSGDPRDKKEWSGTKYSFYHQLMKYYDVDILMMDTVWAKKIDILRMLVLTMGRQKTKFGLLNSFLNSKKVQRRLKHGDYDAAFVFDCTSIPFLHTKTPIVYFTDTTIHLMQHYYWDYRWPLNWEADFIQKNCLKRSDMVLASSTWAINDMVDYYGIDPRKCKLCKFGPNGKVVESPKSPKANDAVNLVFVGVEWKRKGGDIAIETFRELKEMDKNHQWHLDIVGCKPEVEVQEEGITFHGFLDRNNPGQEKRLVEVFKEGDIFILPTKAECSAIVFCEASAYGLPIVTYDTGGLGDYVINGVNGYRLPIGSSSQGFAEKILEIESNSELWLQLSNGGKKLYSESLNWDVAGKTVKETVDSLCFLDEK